MDNNIKSILERFDALEGELLSWQGRIGDPEILSQLNRWHNDLGALRFHLNRSTNDFGIMALLGGTGTGKSTLTNRLLEIEGSATSFRRTFTGGPIAFIHPTMNLPESWLGLPHFDVSQEDLPVRGQSGSLMVVSLENEWLSRRVLIDTPDVDGDAETHYDQAERVFRWSHSIIFLVTPEKYQMTELIPFYRLAQRYEIPTIFVMNKCEGSDVVEDFRSQIEGRGFNEPHIYSIPRDDSTYEPPDDFGLTELRNWISETQMLKIDNGTGGLANRIQDSILRLNDQIFVPLRNDLATVERLRESLESFVAPGPEVDVSGLTAELQQKMQAKSILYLMGPKRILDRAKKISSTVFNRVTSPRSWFGKDTQSGSQEGETIEAQALPDFHSMLVDQFQIGQSRIRDILEGNDRAKSWLSHSQETKESLWIDPERAGTIVDEEIESLNHWLKERWETTPRDTKTILNLLSHIPGGKKIVEWSEASPYLLVLVAASYSSFFGPIDLLVIGGYSLATWLGEKLSNEVTHQVRRTNQTIYRRFERLMKDQVANQIHWLSQQVPSRGSIENAEKEMNRLADCLESVGTDR